MVGKKIKLLHVTSSLKIGGAEAVLVNIIKKLGDREFDHHVIFFHDGPNVEQVERLGAKVYRVKGIVSLYDPVFFMRLFFLIKKLSPNIIHSLLWSANIAARVIAWFLQIPNVSVYHLDIFHDGVFRTYVDRVTRKMANLIIAVSDDVAKSLGDPKSYNRIKIVKNGVDVSEVFKKSAEDSISRESVGLMLGNLVIGSVGRLHAQKNYNLLLKSFSIVNKEFPQTRLVIVGVGPQEDLLKNMAKQLGVEEHVRFIVGKRAYGYYPIFDIFVQPSDKEGLSIALLEAMLFGLPCIVTSSNGHHPVIFNKKNGIITSVGDKQMLASAIASLIQDGMLAKKIGTEGKKRVMAGFSDSAMVSAYKKVFLSLSNRKLQS